MNKFIALTALTLSFSTFQPALAEQYEGGNNDLSKTMPREKYKSMTDEDRQKFHQERKEKWGTMSKEDKLKTIETRRAEKKEKTEEKWRSMSDDEKIGFVEKRMQKRSEHKGGKHKGHEKVAE